MDVPPETTPEHDDERPDEAPVVKALHIPCRGCGAMLAYRPGTAILHCAHCGSETPIDGIAEAGPEIDYHEALERLRREQETVEVPTVRCVSCGATVALGAEVAASDCPFCGTHLNLVQQTTRVIKPGSVLPFALDREHAEKSFRDWLHGLWFAPSSLKREAWKEKRLQGVYLPYWTYDALSRSAYAGRRGDHYWVTVGSGKNRRRVRKTRWRSVAGRVGRRFDDVLVAGSGSVPRRHLDALEPWDLERLVGFDNRFIAGFAAEAYQVGLEQGFGEAQAIMRRVIEADVRRDIGGDEQVITALDTSWSGLTFKHVLLPVWLSAYRFRDRTFLFVVNARTGEVRGDRPWSAIKIALAVLGGLAAVGAAIGTVLALR